MTDRVLTTDDLRDIERRNVGVIPSLMECAGAAAAAVACDMLVSRPGRPLVVAGPGNNGGDALVVARLLRARGFDPLVLFGGDPACLPLDAQQAFAAWMAVGGQCVSDYPVGDFSLVVDGIFGIGLARPVEGRYAAWVESMNAGAAPVLALDVPSGLNADTGVAINPELCVRASCTASFIALKPGLLTGDGPDYCGDVVHCPLDLDVGDAGGQIVSPSLFSHRLAPRRRNSHKGCHGDAVILGGAPGMAGAALLAGRSALKLGAGRVYLGMLETLAVDPVQPELMLRRPEEVIFLASAIAIGPGLGQSPLAARLLADVMACEQALVLDADALNLLAQSGALERMLVARSVPALLTPHPAEAARLLGVTVEFVQADRLACARALARRFCSFVALKGCGTVVVSPDGQWFINRTGNPGLASAGSGDVLTGMLVGLLAQGWAPLDALLAAVHLHGAAADQCIAVGVGPVGLSAGELVEPARMLLNRWNEKAGR